MDSEPLENRLHVTARGVRAHGELSGNLLGAQATGEQSRDFGLTRRQTEPSLQLLRGRNDLPLVADDDGHGRQPAHSPANEG